MKRFTPPYTVDFSNRDPDDNVIDLIHQRFSPRAFKKTELDLEVLQTLFDAARWAPSCFNEQPWIFLTSTKQSFDKFLNLLVESNQQWAKHASLIGFVIANKQFSANGKPNPWAEFDCGSAWMALCLQATSMGLYTHGMGGIKKNEIYDAFAIDKDKYMVICGFVVGVIDDPSRLNEDLQAREQPSARKPVGQIWKQGVF